MNGTNSHTQIYRHRQRHGHTDTDTEHRHRHRHRHTEAEREREREAEQRIDREARRNAERMGQRCVCATSIQGLGLAFGFGVRGSGFGVEGAWLMVEGLGVTKLARGVWRTSEASHPRVASIASRACLISASRYCRRRSGVEAKPRGSKP